MVFPKTCWQTLRQMLSTDICPVFSVTWWSMAEGARGYGMKWRTLAFVLLFALMASGGSFTCFYSSGGHDHVDHHDPPPTTNNA